VPHRVAQGRLSFQRSGDATAVRGAYADSPLRILTPRNHGSAAWAYLSTLGGGMVDGDALQLELSVEPAARAFVSTQGPTRIYRSPRGCSSALRAQVEEDAALLLLPDPLACFAGATYRQETRIELADSASLACWEILTAGRAARGERWAQVRYSSSLAVIRSGRTLVDEALLLDPRQGPLQERLGRFDAIATLLLVGPLFEAARAAVRASLDASPLTPGARVLVAASPLGLGQSERTPLGEGIDGAGALLVRCAAASVEELLMVLRGHLASVPPLLGDNPWARRN